MTPGRKPLPTELKEARGNPGKRPLNQEEPKPKRLTRAPACPEYLHGLAREQWKRKSVQLLRLGVLTELDLDALERYCVIYQRWREAEARTAKEGQIITTSNGYPVQSPWLAIANKCAEQLNALDAQFGLTPSTRSRIKATPSDEKDQKDLAERLFNTKLKK